MPFDGLEQFINAADEIGELARVNGADLDMEVGALTELVGERKGPMLLFDGFKGYQPGHRIVSNPLRNPRRMALAMGFPLDAHPVDMLRLWKDRKTQLNNVPPRYVDDGPILSQRQTGDDVDITSFPAPRWHPRDGGRYIGTGDMVVVRDPDEQWVNVGTYRGMVQAKDRLSLWINPQKHGRIIIEKYWERGQAAPIAVVLGAEPITWMAASMSPPYGFSEYELAGAYRDAPVDLVNLPGTGLPVPANAEIVIEGEMPPVSEECADEGPFGEWPGYYAHSGKEPVVRIKSIYYRPQPILLGMAPLRPLGDGSSIGIPTLTISVWEHLERSGITGIAGVWSFCSQLMVVVSLRQRYAGHAQQALQAMSGLRHGDMKRYYIAVDDDIDPSNLEEVVWAISTRVDPATSMTVLPHGWTAALDPMLSPAQRESGDLTMSRMMINACKPWTWRDQFPVSNVFTREERKAVEAKWADFLGEVLGKR